MRVSDPVTWHFAVRRVASWHIASAVTCLHGAGDLALGVALLDGGTLVVELLALADANLDLHAAFLGEIHGERNEGIALL